MTTRLFFIIAAALTLQACSGSRNSSPQTVQHARVKSIGLYISRAALGQVDYEQYKLNPPLLVAECGIIARGKHSPREQNTLVLTEEQLRTLDEAAWEIKRAFARKPVRLPSPGTNRHLADPGEFFFDLMDSTAKLGVRTSLDFITASNSNPGTRLRRLAEALRALPPEPPCRLRNFYGLPRLPTR